MGELPRPGRRAFLRLAAAGALAGYLPGLPAADAMARRRIPGSDEMLPVIGLGTSDEFERMPADGGSELTAVIGTLLEHGGSLIDTAPGYGDAESVLGELLTRAGRSDDIYLSTKVRTRGEREGMRSLERSLRLLRKDPLDLAMVHSLVDVETQLDNLERFRNEGHVRHIGITTSSTRDHAEMAAIIESRELDFVQVNYSPLEPGAAERVIPAARDNGVAVMVNRAFLNGRYFGLVRGRELPDWVANFDCDSWAQFALKWVLGNPDVTCVLAATSNPRHMADNSRGGIGRLPEAEDRERMRRLLADL